MTPITDEPYPYDSIRPRDQIEKSRRRMELVADVSFFILAVLILSGTVVLGLIVGRALLSKSVSGWLATYAYLTVSFSCVGSFCKARHDDELSDNAAEGWIRAFYWQAALLAGFLVALISE